MWSMVNGVPKRDNYDFMTADQAASYRAALKKSGASDYNSDGSITWGGAGAGSGRDGLVRGPLYGDGVLTQQEMDQYNANYHNGGGSFMSDLFDGVKQLAVPAALAGLAIASSGAAAGFFSSLGSAIPEIGSVMAGGEGLAGAATVADAATTAASNAAFGSSLSGYAGAAGAAGVADAATTAAGNSAFGDSLAGYGGGGATVADAATTAAGNSAFSNGLSGYAGPAGGTAGAAGGMGASSLFNGAKTGMSALGSLLGGGSGALGPQLGNIGSNLLSANGANQAAQTQANAATQTIAMQQGMFDKSQQNLQPYMAGGAQAMGQLNGKLADGSLGGTFTGADYLANKDPGYEFQLNQGNQALQNSQAARDGVLGGSSLKGLIDYNQGVASTGYQSAYQRWLSSQQNTYGQLSGAAGIGANAAAGSTTNASNFANSIGGNMTGRGNSLAAGQVGQAKAYSQMTSGAGNMMYALRDMVNPSGSPYSAPTNASPYGPSQQQGYGLGSEFDQYKSQSPSDSQ